MKSLALLSLLVLGCHGTSVRQQRRFPSDFLFGTATAAYQIEGAWDADDKGENIWDNMVHNRPEVIRDHSNGDIAADSYHNYRRDVEMMRELGLDAYRFSLSWSRILPTGRSNRVSEAGVAYYNNLINEMLRYNITPLVTLYHWDLPQPLQDLGGFANPLFPEWFEDYARVVFENFGDRVKSFITFNEPRQICEDGYGLTSKAPILNATGIGEYLCAKYLVLGHARAYRAYVQDFKQEQGGEVGITINVNYFGPHTDSEEDQFAVELNRQANWGIYTEPIFSSQGGWPRELEERVAQKSAEQGYSSSRLPSFTDEEIELARGASDFFGVNHYTSYVISASQNLRQNPVPSTADDINVGRIDQPDWPTSASSWLTHQTACTYNAISILAERYNNPKFYITENGWSTAPDAGLDDEDRIRYYRAALESVLDAIEAGINLQGYMAWSLMDNFEWMQGYTERFGLYEVDFESPARTRTPRKSAFVYKEIIRSRVIDHSYEPPTRIMTIDPGH